MSKYSVLVVDDETANLHKLKRTFVDSFRVLEATSGEQALDLLQEHTVAAIITDQRMPGMSGVELLRRSLELSPDTIRIILTGYTDVEDLMEAINQGHVHRYITKPWDPFSLKETVGRELERWELKRENAQLGEELQRLNAQLARENVKLKQEVEALQEGDRPLIYQSRAMQDLLNLLDRVVSTNSTVLIQGETGTGKELLARYVHNHSDRSEGPFVPVNCGAIPAELTESSFFGHRRGAFTGASSDRKGFFELAHRGTLFLDEVAEAPLDLQVKFLRALQESEIFPVGAQEPCQIDVRVIASTNRNLGAMADKAQFRQDLFFRLNVFSVHVPPLRARTEDIEVLVEFFLERSARRLNKAIGGIEPETLHLLGQHHWPGNVRELENEIERLVILCDPGQSIPPAMLAERIRYASQKENTESSLKEQLAELEKSLILDALKVHNQNRSHAAVALGISRQTIIAKLKQYQQG